MKLYKCNRAGVLVDCKECDHAEPHERVETWPIADTWSACWCTEWHYCWDCDKSTSHPIKRRCVRVEEEA